MKLINYIILPLLLVALMMAVTFVIGASKVRNEKWCSTITGATYNRDSGCGIIIDGKYLRLRRESYYEQ